jgi:hypothetical protein
MPDINNFPPMPNGGPWSSNHCDAFFILRDMHHHSNNVIRREEGEPIRLNILWNDIFNKAIPLLEALLSSGFPEDWVETATHCFGQLAVDLKAAQNAAEER